MKKIYKKIIAIIFFSVSFCALLNAQVISNVPQIFQEQAQWCWAGCTKCVLTYYGHPNAQCTIAEYTRTVATWNNFGSVNCCVDPSQGCDYWNYNYGATGSMEDILLHFGNLQTNNISSSLSTSQILTEVNKGSPFIFRWAWTSGGGHFLVGYGISGSSVYYMNPAPGYGYQIDNYNWLVNDGNHDWTHTQTLPSPTTGIAEDNNLDETIAFPNPSNGNLEIEITDLGFTNAELKIYDVLGEVVLKSLIINPKAQMDLSSQPNGLYFLSLIEDGKTFNQKIIISR